MSNFNRENRYIVIKLDRNDPAARSRVENYVSEMGFKTVEGVTVETDWPEYETVWRMIEQRVTGASADANPVEILGYSVVGNRYAIRLTKGEVLELSEIYADHLIELVDHKHLTTSQSELAALREELATAKAVMSHDYELVTQRLTAAEQRNAVMEKLLREMRSLPQKRCAAFIANIIDVLDAKPTESGASE